MPAEEILAAKKVGDKIKFAEEARPYTVRARGVRYLVCTKPFNLRKTVLYTIIDLTRMMRGTENLVFGRGAETDQECEAMLARLEGRDIDIAFATAVSHRNCVPVVLAAADQRIAA